MHYAIIIDNELNSFHLGQIIIIQDRDIGEPVVTGQSLYGGLRDDLYETELYETEYLILRKRSDIKLGHLVYGTFK